MGNTISIKIPYSTGYKELVMVTDKCNPHLIRDMKMHHVFSLEEAVAMAEDIAGKNAGTVVIPDGVGVIVQCTNRQS